MFFGCMGVALIRQAVSGGVLRVRLLPTVPVAVKIPKLPLRNETDARRLQAV